MIRGPNLSAAAAILEQSKNLSSLERHQIFARFPNPVFRIRRVRNNPAAKKF